MLLADVPRSAEDERRIDGCDDVAALDRWIRRAPTATRAADVFDA